jgi:hypothetical protein
VREFLAIEHDFGSFPAELRRDHKFGDANEEKDMILTSHISTDPGAFNFAAHVSPQVGYTLPFF